MQRVQLGTTQSIASYPRLAPGAVLTAAPTSVTALRVTPVAKDTAYQPATVDPLSTSTDAAISEGATSFTINPTGDYCVAGRRYLLTDPVTLRTEIVVAAGNNGVETNYLQEPICRDFPSATNVNGLQCSITLTADQTAQVGSGYVLFRATVGADEYEWSEPFRIVRRVTQVVLTTTALFQLYPIARKILSSSDTTGDEAIEAVWQAVVVPLLAAKGILDEDIITDDVLMPLHAAATVLHLARQWPQSSSEFVDRLSLSYEQTKEITFARIDLAIRSQEEAMPEPPAPGNEPVLTGIRLTR